MIVLSGDQIKTCHWWIAISLAALLHALLLLGLRHKEVAVEESGASTPGIVINLKKINKTTTHASPQSAGTRPADQILPQADVPPTPNDPQPQVPREQPKPKAKPDQQSKPTPKPQPKHKEVRKKETKQTPKEHTIVSKPASTMAATIEPLPDRKVASEGQPNMQSHMTDTSSDVKLTQHQQAAELALEKSRYMRQLSLWLGRHKEYPTIARRRHLEGEVIIQFVIDREGHLLRHTIIQPSPHQSLNRATVNMLKRASPMPAVPANIAQTKSEFEYEIPVKFDLSGR